MPQVEEDLQHWCFGNSCAIMELGCIKVSLFKNYTGVNQPYSYMQEPIIIYVDLPECFYMLAVVL